MVEHIECYKDSTGKIHEVAFNAFRADLVAWFAKSEDINEASARKLVDYLTATTEMTIETIEMLRSVDVNRPLAPAVAEAAI